MTTSAYPFVEVPGVLNFRDISCKPAVRRGLVYRSANASHLSPAGRDALQSLGIRAVFDLRSGPEIEQNVMKEFSGQARDQGGGGGGQGEGGEGEGLAARRIWTPVFSDEDYSPENLAIRFKEYAQGGSEGFIHAYARILESGASAFRTILLHLAGPESSSLSPAGQSSASAEDQQQERPLPTPCLIHCTAGKDRTGVIVAVILSLLGVDDDAIATEYGLTEVGLAAVKEVFVQRVLQMESFRRVAGREGAELLVSARKENMLATLALLRDRYGGARGYVNQVCGLTDAEIGRIRANLVLEQGSMENEERALM